MPGEVNSDGYRQQRSFSMGEDSLKCWQWAVVVEMQTQAQLWPHEG